MKPRISWFFCCMFFERVRGLHQINNFIKMVRFLKLLITFYITLLSCAYRKWENNSYILNVSVFYKEIKAVMTLRFAALVFSKATTKKGDTLSIAASSNIICRQVAPLRCGKEASDMTERIMNRAADCLLKI